MGLPNSWPDPKFVPKHLWGSRGRPGPEARGQEPRARGGPRAARAPGFWPRPLGPVPGTWGPGAGLGARARDSTNQSAVGGFILFRPPGKLSRTGQYQRRLSPKASLVSLRVRTEG